MTIRIESASSEWPRRRQIDMGPLHLFRNPDAGIGLMVDGWRLIGPGQCGQERAILGFKEDWCYRPFRHSGRHAYNAADAVAANEETA